MMLDDKKINKLGRMLEIAIFLAILTVIIITKSIPQLKEAIGSSDLYIKYDNYTSVIGIETKDELDFALILKNDNLSGILFFNEESLIFYNQNIENNEIEKAIVLITNILDDYGINNNIKVINYGQDDDIYDKIKMYMLNKYNTGVDFSTAKLQEKEDKLGIEKDEEDLLALETLYTYSARIIKLHKNEELIEKNYGLKQENAMEYANNIYKKLIVYTEYVNNQPITDDNYPIQLIEVDSELTSSNKRVVPNSNSWYYIKNRRVYAYIEFSDNNKSYGFCFSGSIDSMKEGKCNERTD